MPVSKKRRKFIDDPEEQTATKEIWQHINSLYTQINHLVTFKYHLLIYRLVKYGYIKIEHLEEVAGLSKQRIYQIVGSFEEKELERGMHG